MNSQNQEIKTNPAGREFPNDQAERIKKFNELKLSYKQLTVFEVTCGDKVKTIQMFRDNVYDPHFVDDEVIFIHWHKGVSDLTNYYLPINNEQATRVTFEQIEEYYDELDKRMPPINREPIEDFIKKVINELK